MKRYCLVLLASVQFISSYSQSTDWDLFPSGALRYFEETGSGSHVAGVIDYRSVDTNSNGNEVIKLEKFTKRRYLEIDNEYYKGYSGLQYLTGNSVLGNRIVKEETYTYMILLNDSIKSQVQDTFLFLNSKNIGSIWTCYEDSLLLITGKNQNVKRGNTPLGQDSIRTIIIASLNKNSGLELNYTLEVGKTFGLIQAFDVGAFLKFDHNSYFTEILNLQLYKELTKTEFFTIEPNTIVQSTSPFYYEDGFYYQDYYSRSYYNKNDKLYSDVAHTKTKFSPDPNDNNLYYERDTIRGELVVQEDVGEEIYNPLLGFRDRLEGYGFGKYCDSGYVVRKSICSECGGWGYLDENQDTLARPMIVGNSRLWSKTYYSGIGLTRSTYQDIDNWNTYLETQYFRNEIYEVRSKYEALNGITKLNYQSIKTYPNPASSSIRLDGLNVSNAEVQVFDLMGKRVDVPVLGENRLDVSGLATGIYMVEVLTDGKRYRGKFIKQ